IEDRVVGLLEVYDVLERALVQSFDHAALRRIRAMDRGIRLGALIAELPLDAAVVAPGMADAICPGDHLLTAGEDVDRILRAGLDCHVWTVNEPARMDRLVEWHVSGIITDRPGVLRGRLGCHGGASTAPP
ncbi:MAG: glycerophosphodiester phosphodiesterase, partial [Candidatus Rokubacteria bacterium]|nr:glycerophosphodiester phosphodiesterase [Candidatus Rokubacteria bacterium]